jgi:DNA polymerase-3 subunit delta
VFGDEPLLATEAADLIRHKAREQGCNERQVLSVESGFNWNALHEASANLSLFGDRRLIDLRIPTGKPGKEGAAALEAFARTTAGDNLLLVTCPVKLDRTAQSAKWFTALDSAGATVPVYPVERSRLPAWIVGRLKRQGQSVDADTLQFLADKVEGNLLAAFQEVQKLGLLFPEGPLGFEQVKSAVCDVARYDVFRLADAALAGDAARCARMLEGLKGEGEDPILVLWALTREARIQTVIQEQARAGKNLGMALAAAKVWESRRELTERCAKRLKNADAARLLAKAGELDRTIKGLMKGDVWDGLLQLALGLALGKGIVLQ